jgi:hypothetical protein
MKTKDFTLCTDHFNSPEFPDATSHTIRRFHSAARVMVVNGRAQFSNAGPRSSEFPGFGYHVRAIKC